MQRWLVRQLGALSPNESMYIREKDSRRGTNLGLRGWEYGRIVLSESLQAIPDCPCQFLRSKFIEVVWTPSFPFLNPKEQNDLCLAMWSFSHLPLDQGALNGNFNR